MIEIVLVYNVDREQIRNSAANRLIGEVVNHGEGPYYWLA